MMIQIENRARILPDFFVAGAAKGATTSLHALLSQHPQIFLPERKELYTFAFNGERPRFKLADGTHREKVGCSWKQYFKYYEKSPAGFLAGDTSSWYLRYHETVIGKIRQLYGEAARNLKFIMVLRNPVERAFSHYSMHRGQSMINEPFGDTIVDSEFRKKITDPAAGYYPGYDYIGFGMYSGQVRAYLDAFGHDNVKVFLFEEFHKDNGAVADEIARFLGLETLGQWDPGKKLNISGEPKTTFAAFIGKLVFRPSIFKRLSRFLLPLKVRAGVKNNVGRLLYNKTHMSEEDRKTLIDIYRKDIGELQTILGRDLSSWLGGK